MVGKITDKVRDGHQAEHELLVCPCGKGGHQHRGCICRDVASRSFPLLVLVRNLCSAGTSDGLPSTGAVRIN